MLIGIPERLRVVPKNADSINSDPKWEAPTKRGNQLGGTYSFRSSTIVNCAVSPGSETIDGSSFIFMPQVSPSA